MTIATATSPPLPLEVKGHILRFCDPPTLAVTSRVSLAFLELSGPLLYRDIVVRGRERLEKLIRSDTVLPSVGPYISLAQTKTLEYRLQETEFDEKLYDISRPLGTTPVAVDTFVLDAQADRDPEDYINLDVLFDSLNPVHLHVIGPKTCRDPCSRLVELSEDLLWPRLRMVTWENALSCAFLSRTPFARQNPLVDLVLDITGSDAYSTDFWSALETLHDNLDGNGVDKDEDKGAFGQVQVWLNDAREVTEAKQMLGGYICECLDMRMRPPTTP